MTTPPPPPAQPYQPTAVGPAKRPGTVIAAFIVGLVYSIIGIIIYLVGVFALLAVTGMGAAAQVDMGGAAGVIGIAITVLVVAMIVAALLLVFSILAFNGRNWARWAVIVMAAIVVVLAFVNLFFGQFDYFGFIFAAALIVLYVVPPSAAWYASKSASA